MRGSASSAASWRDEGSKQRFFLTKSACLHNELELFFCVPQDGCGGDGLRRGAGRGGEYLRGAGNYNLIYIISKHFSKSNKPR